MNVRLPASFRERMWIAAQLTGSPAVQRAVQLRWYRRPLKQCADPIGAFDRALATHAAACDCRDETIITSSLGH